MAFLFDTNAISELLRKRPAPRYLQWIENVPRAEQLTSAVVIGELYKGAFRSQAPERHLDNIELRILPALTVLPFDVAVARVYGEIRARLEKEGRPLVRGCRSADRSHGDLPRPRNRDRQSQALRTDSGCQDQPDSR